MKKLEQFLLIVLVLSQFCLQSKSELIVVNCIDCIEFQEAMSSEVVTQLSVWIDLSIENQDLSALQMGFDGIPQLEKLYISILACDPDMTSNDISFLPTDLSPLTVLDTFWVDFTDCGVIDDITHLDTLLPTINTSSLSMLILKFEGNVIVNASPIASASGLTELLEFELNLRNNMIADLSSFAGIVDQMMVLEFILLDFRGNVDIADISVFSNFFDSNGASLLTVIFDFTYSSVQDITAFSTTFLPLVAAEMLIIQVQDSMLSDISPLAMAFQNCAMVDTIKLLFWTQPISDTSAFTTMFAGLTNLMTVDIYLTNSMVENFDDFSASFDDTMLENLLIDIAGAPLNDCSGLHMAFESVQLVELTLKFGETMIPDIMELPMLLAGQASLQKLTYYVNRNMITDIEPLAVAFEDNVMLTEVVLVFYENQITDISPIQKAFKNQSSTDFYFGVWFSETCGAVTDDADPEIMEIRELHMMDSCMDQGFMFPTYDDICLNQLNDIQDSTIEAILDEMTLEDVVYYMVTMAYVDYEFDHSCFSQKVMVNDMEMEATIVDNELGIVLDTRLLNEYGCQQNGGSNLVCSIMVHIMYEEHTQHIHEVELTSNLLTSGVTLDLGSSSSNSGDIGNPLEIETTFAFCEDFLCTTPMMEPMYERGDDIYFMLSIMTEGYMDYHLAHITVVYNDEMIMPQQVLTEVPGNIYYHIVINQLIQNEEEEHVLTVFTHLAGQAEPEVERMRLRRVLEQNADADNYVLKNKQQFSIVDPDAGNEQGANDSNSNKGESNDNTVAIVVGTLSGIVGLALIGGIGYKVYSNKSKKSEKKYLENESAEQFQDRKAEN